MEGIACRRSVYEKISNKNPNCYVNENRYIRLKIINLQGFVAYSDKLCLYKWILSHRHMCNYKFILG